MTTDVCVVTYRSEETIGALLTSVHAHLSSARVLICDNSPDDATAAAVTTALAALDGAAGFCRVERPGDNLGFGEGCNRLAAGSDATWLVFVNPDAEITAFDLQLDELPQEVIVGAVVRGLDGDVQATFGPDRTIWREISIRLLRRRPTLALSTTPFDVDFVSGAAFAVRREDFLRWGGFDVDRYFMYYEDIDLCRRARESGGRVLVHPGWAVNHIGGHSAKKAHEVALTRSFESASNYHRRWSRAWWLFRPVAVAEALAKALMSVPRGGVGQTSRSTQWRFLGRLLGRRT